jgi:hypothetical protein
MDTEGVSMLLNTDIIFDNLSQFVTLERYGRKNDELNLKRPVFYIDGEPELHSNQVYISYADQLPTEPITEGGFLVICLGSSPPPAAYYSGVNGCFLINEATDLFTVFNLVQKVYDKYDEWDAALTNTLYADASISELIRLSFPILENPLFVIGANYDYLAYSDIVDCREDLACFRPDHDSKFENLCNSINNESIKLTKTSKTHFMVSDKGLVNFVIQNGLCKHAP